MGAMKRVLLIAMLVICAFGVTGARAVEPVSGVTMILLGSPGSDRFEVTVTPDGTLYEIKSLAALEIGGDVCKHPQGDPLRLQCSAPMITGFEIRTEEGDDEVLSYGYVRAPMTIDGGPGNDRLLGGVGSDWLIGGSGGDRIHPGLGSDRVNAGSGPDIASGGFGDDLVLGEAGSDNMAGGAGADSLIGGPNHDNIYAGSGDDLLNGGPEFDFLSGGPGADRYIASDEDHIVADAADKSLGQSF